MRQLVWAAAAVVIAGLLTIAGSMIVSAPEGDGGPPPITLRRGDLTEMAPPLTALHPHPTHDDWLLATGPHRVAYVTRTRGRSWEPLLVHEPWPRRDLPVPDRVYGWDAHGGLFVQRGDELRLSLDGGVSFAEALDQPEVAAGTQDFETARGDWRLREGTPEFRAVGTTRWEPRTKGLERPLPVSAVQHPREPDQAALIDAAGHLWTTPDLAETWRRAPVEAVQQALFLDAPDASWLVRTDVISMSQIGPEGVRALGPDPSDLPRLVVPPYLEHPRDPRHQQRMLAQMMRRPVLESAGLRDDGALWVHLDGIDAARDRWLRDPSTGRWTSEERAAEGHPVAAWGEVPRTACRVALQGSAAFVRDTPVPTHDPPHGHPLAVGFAGDDVLYVVAERGVHLRRVDDQCAPGELLGAWHWEHPALHRALIAPEEHGLRLLGLSEHGVWRQRFALDTPPP